ncbi:Peptidoglycan/LPS O-acetylase OafA/YrhL, contains acyltransferase and SGNH-hydrolase domains [Rhodospirillales bacterium URHD0017]|nr:Peptidoglycan/LPS O-acetylase OafA/YrhL, contains acyltransferase and SGNH-hydrolase domains [Rhodospirillales bacterium URHD0017]
MQGNLSSLQILRAIAATSVVYYHIALPAEAGAIPRFGSFGVDVFFVISGFVMALVVAKGQLPAAFAINRITRIAPFYWLLTTGILILALTEPQLLLTTTASLRNYLKSIFFIPYFKESGELQPMLVVGWTLNYEMFFYLCIWLSILASRKHYALLTLVLLIVTYIGFGKLSGNDVLERFFGRLIIFEFTFGMLAYHIYKRGVLKRLGNKVLLLIAVSSYAFMAFAETKALPVDRALLFGLPSLALILSATAVESLRLLNWIPRGDAFSAIGDASYATYLSHFYVVEGLRRLVFPRLPFLDPYTPLGVLIIVGASLAVGQILYSFCDKPLSNFFRNKLLAARQVPERAWVARRGPS